MKRLCVLGLLSLFPFLGMAQGAYGVQLGIGRTTAYNSRFTTTVSGFYMARLSPRIYLGGELAIQKYSFTYEAGLSAPAYSDIISVSQKSYYMFVSPKFDLGIGYHKHVHFTFSAGAGLLMGGYQNTDQHTPLWVTNGVGVGADTMTTETTRYMRNFLYRIGGGITERIPTHGYWSITLSQDFSFLPTRLNNGGANLNTSYFCFTVGIMHKYPQTLVEY